jgi:hypothetical protein
MELLLPICSIAFTVLVTLAPFHLCALSWMTQKNVPASRYGQQLMSFLILVISFSLENLYFLSSG